MRHWLLAQRKLFKSTQNGVLKIVCWIERRHRIILTRRDGIRNAGIRLACLRRGSLWLFLSLFNFWLLLLLQLFLLFHHFSFLLLFQFPLLFLLQLSFLSLLLFLLLLFSFLFQSQLFDPLPLFLFLLLPCFFLATLLFSTQFFLLQPQFFFTSSFFFLLSPTLFIFRNLLKPFLLFRFFLLLQLLELFLLLGVLFGFKLFYQPSRSILRKFFLVSVLQPLLKKLDNLDQE